MGAGDFAGARTGTGCSLLIERCKASARETATTARTGALDPKIHLFKAKWGGGWRQGGVVARELLWKVDAEPGEHVRENMEILAPPDADNDVEGENGAQCANDEEGWIGPSLRGPDEIGRDARRDQDEVGGGGDGRDDQLRMRIVAGVDEVEKSGPTGVYEGGDEEVSGVPEGGDTDCGSVPNDFPACTEDEDTDVDQ